MSPKSYQTTSWYDERVEIRPSLIQGGGMFARRPIQAGEIVAIVGGTVMTEDEFHAYIATTSRFNATQIGEHLHLVDLIQAPETLAGSINHSCDSNLWLQDEVTIVARRAVASGEELTLDYALTTVEPHWQLDQPCQCGTTVCRHTIRGTDWQLSDVQQRYQGHFAPFINERILNLPAVTIDQLHHFLPRLGKTLLLVHHPPASANRAQERDHAGQQRHCRKPGKRL